MTFATFEFGDDHPEAMAQMVLDAMNHEEIIEFGVCTRSRRSYNLGLTGKFSKIVDTVRTVRRVTEHMISSICNSRSSGSGNTR